MARARQSGAVLAAAVLLSAFPAYASSYVPAEPSHMPAAHVPAPRDRMPGYLGIEFHDVPGSGAVPSHSVEVVVVDHDGPAGKAGLQPHDIIVKLNGLAVESGDALRHMIHEAGSGTMVALSVLRGSRSMTLTAQLSDRDQVAKAAWAEHMADDPGAAPADSAYAAAAAPVPEAKPQGFVENLLRFGPYTGLTVAVMEPQLANYFGAPGNKGLLVHEVESNSPAAAAGLRAGDVLLRADSLLLATASDWSRSLHACKGHAMSVTVLRDRHELTLTLMPDAKKRSMLELPVIFANDHASLD
jgi:serine protease Do